MNSRQKVKKHKPDAPSSLLVESLYRSLVDEKALQEFLDGCSDALSSDLVMLLHHNFSDPEKSLLHFNSAAEEDEFHYHRFASRGDFVDRSLPYIQPGTVVRLPVLLKESLFRKTQFHDYFCLQHGFANGMAATVHADDEYLVVLVFNRTNNKPFDAQDQQWLEQLVPHLLNYHRLAGHVRHLDLGIRRAHRALDALNFGVAMIGRRKAVRFMNRKAQALVDRLDSLVFEKDQLRSTRTEVDAWLSSRVREAVQGKAIFKEADASLVLQEGDERLHLFVLPMKANSPGSPAGCVVLMSDMQIDADKLSYSIASMYGLSARESQVAALLTQGFSAAQISERMQVKQSTIRTLIKRVFAKTEVSRQSDLIRIGLSVNLH